MRRCGQRRGAVAEVCMSRQGCHRILGIRPVVSAVCRACLSAEDPSGTETLVGSATIVHSLWQIVGLMIVLSSVRALPRGFTVAPAAAQEPGWTPMTAAARVACGQESDMRRSRCGCGLVVRPMQVPDWSKPMPASRSGRRSCRSRVACPSRFPLAAVRAGAAEARV
jgi:hypothetical protein